MVASGSMKTRFVHRRSSDTETDGAFENSELCRLATGRL